MIKFEYYLIALFFLCPVILFSQDFIRQQFLENASKGTQEGQFEIEHEIECFTSKNSLDLIYEFDISYGISNALAVEFIVPFFITRKEPGSKSSGISDLMLELQWSFYRQPLNIGILTGGLIFPTGNKEVLPILGGGSPGFKLEFDGIHASERWFAELTAGTLLYTERKSRSKLGNIYYYNLMGGIRFKFNPKSLSTFFTNFQFDGLSFAPSKRNEIINPNSGGNVLFFGPLLAWSRKSFLVQALAQVPIGQHLLGNQPNFEFHGGLSVQVTF